MARPQKMGLEYFPLDVDFLNDRKFRNCKQKYGYLAPLVYLALLSLIYKDKGYYIEYSDRTKADVLWDIQASLQGKHCPDIQTLADVIDTLVADGLFAADLYHDVSVLTSKRLQRTYYSATVDRTGIAINKAIWLLSIEDMTALSSKHLILSQIVNRTNNAVNQANNSINQPNNAQSKVKESKVNKSKVSSATAQQRHPADFDYIAKYGEGNLVALNNGQYAQLCYRYGVEVAEVYIDKMAYQIRYKGKTYKQPYDVLRRWLLSDGVPLVHDGAFTDELEQGETVQAFIKRYFQLDDWGDYVPAPTYKGDTTT